LTNKLKLTDAHMDMSMSLLKFQFPSVAGLESTLLVQSLRGFSVQMDSSALVVQIHHTGADHWVTSMRARSSFLVKVYDFLLSFDQNYKPRLTDSLKEQVSQIYRSKVKEITVIFPQMSRQRNAVDCRLYAVTTAVDICFGNDPAQKDYNIAHMRTHLLGCLEAQYLEVFPSTDKIRKHSYHCDIPVFCYCRRPLSGTMIECAQCSRSFHYDCTNHTGGDFHCNFCSSL